MRPTSTITANETIHGVEFRDIPDVGDVPLFADFSSSIASEPLDVSQFGADLRRRAEEPRPGRRRVVIVRRDLLERAGQPRADIFDYRSHLKGESMLNTPPTWNWYLAGLVFKWMLAEGGVEEFARRNARKSALLYDVDRRLRRLLPQRGRAGGALAHERAVLPARRSARRALPRSRPRAAGLICAEGPSRARRHARLDLQRDAGGRACRRWSISCAISSSGNG